MNKFPVTKGIPFISSKSNEVDKVEGDTEFDKQ